MMSQKRPIQLGSPGALLKPGVQKGSSMTITILLVEDDQKVRGLLRGRLETAGYAVVETSSAEEALAR